MRVKMKEMVTPRRKQRAMRWEMGVEDEGRGWVWGFIMGRRIEWREMENGKWGGLEMACYAVVEHVEGGEKDDEKEDAAKVADVDAAKELRACDGA